MRDVGGVGESGGGQGERDTHACIRGLLVPDYCSTSIGQSLVSLHPWRHATCAANRPGPHAARSMSGLATSSPLLRQLQLFRLLAVVQLRWKSRRVGRQSGVLLLVSIYLFFHSCACAPFLLWLRPLSAPPPPLIGRLFLGAIALPSGSLDAYRTASKSLARLQLLTSSPPPPLPPSPASASTVSLEYPAVPPPAAGQAMVHLIPSSTS